jgi:hypothetical protein
MRISKSNSPVSSLLGPRYMVLHPIWANDMKRRAERERERDWRKEEERKRNQGNTLLGPFNVTSLSQTIMSLFQPLLGTKYDLGCAGS